MYNRTRQTEALLDKNKGNPPSFTVYLHPDYWALNNGPKFLYQNQIASILDDVRAHKIPVDFLDLFDNTNVPWYQGCMIVELQDYRPEKRRDGPLASPNKTRIVLHPDSETMFADICALNNKLGGKLTDREALEIEAKLLLATSEPLCLDPDPHLSRIANHIARVSASSAPASLKRKAAAADLEEDEADRVKRTKILGLMNPRQGRTVSYSYRILDVLAKRGKPARLPPPRSAEQQSPTNATPPRPGSAVQPPANGASSSQPSTSPVTQSPAQVTANGRPPTPQQAASRNGVNNMNGHHSPPPPQAGSVPYANPSPPPQHRPPPSPAPTTAQSPPMPPNPVNPHSSPPPRIATPSNAAQAYNIAAAMANTRPSIPPQPGPPGHPQPGIPAANFLRQPPTPLMRAAQASNNQQPAQLNPAQQQQAAQYRQQIQQMSQAQVAQQLSQAQALQHQQQQQRLALHAAQQQQQQAGRSTPQQPQQPAANPQMSQWYQHYPHLRVGPGQGQQPTPQQPGQPGRQVMGPGHPYYNLMQQQQAQGINPATVQAFWAIQQAQAQGRPPMFNGQPMSPEMQAAVRQQMQLQVQRQQQAQQQAQPQGQPQQNIPGRG
ncbi:Spt20 family-domain-containing protein [Flagelloscypha sp. PMI_526]|nr:Spt20 family-domain-containing protein [Flagelloscypha sp. PMI_526]